MNLLVDIGNSRLKWALETDGHLGEMTAVDYRQPAFFDDLRQCWQRIRAPKKMAIASVSGKTVLNGLLDLGHSLWPGVETIIPLSSRRAFGVNSAYDQPEKLGVDRWLALIGAHRYYADAVCVADCGTAITFDALQADGKHQGGLIAPGLTLMKKALAADTADLTFDSQPCKMGLATETHAAIANGALMAATGLIEQAMLGVSSDYRLILTGGDAEVIADSLSRPFVIDKGLVLKGLAVFCSGE